jgi:cytochrome o ubiquinol oxidase subunit 2
MNRKGHFILRGLLGLLSLCVAAYLEGCSNILLFDPKGPIGDGERLVIYIAIGLMLIVVLPVLVMNLWFSLKYRASNPNATYMPKWNYSGKIDLTVWLVPIFIVTGLAILSWRETHHLTPAKAIETDGKSSIRIEAVSLDWKYLFIYPDRDIATVNQFVFPAKVPVSFRITSDTVMTSFFIPQLGSQIYAMGGRQTQLHLMADEPGVYRGQNQQFSGSGYADMFFQAKAVSQEEFEAWVQKTKQSADKLDLARWEELRKPTHGYPVTYFSSVMPGLFDHIISQYRPKTVKPGATREKWGSAYARTGTLEGR